jgi:elongation factor P
MISTTDFRKGLKVKLEGEIFYIVDFQHGRTAQRRAQVRTKLKNIRTGAVLERTFSAGETFDEPDFEEKTMQFLYSSGSDYHFMDSKTYDQISLEGQPVNLDLPTSIVLKITSTEPGIKGDSVTNLTKSATLETGLQVKVPLFINEGEYVKIDTRTNEYIERVQQR